MGGDANQSLFNRALPVSLPKVQAWRVRPPAPEPRGVEDSLYEKFGYNDIDEVWQPTTTYARWVQPSQEELAKQVEYDLPLEGKIWLDKVNIKRKQEGLDEISYEFLEIVLDKLEKEWFDLSRHFPKRDSNMLVEDSKCTICDDGECEASNAIVFCDGCNLAVHQDCYGVPYIPEGQWLCRKCTVSPGRSVTCMLCPNKEGGFKQTVNGQWAHLLCAIWINETWVSNTVFMEPIDGIESIPKQRWRLICSLCKKRAGACIQCSKSSCYTAYHVTCAQQNGLYLKLGTDSGATTTEDSGGANISYCEKHSRQALGVEEDESRIASEELPEQGRQKKRKLIAHGSRRESTSGLGDADDSFASAYSNRASTSTSALKGKRAESPPKKKKKEKRKGPKIETPIIPLYVHQRVWDYIKPLRCSKKRAFVAQVERYWSILRRRRRGAPLLNRLHLEPWTASAGAPREATDLQREETLQLTIQLRMDLEKIRQVMELVRKREEQKLRKAHLVKQVIDAILFPQTNVFRATLREIQRLDARLLFYKPVSKIEVPDYHVIVKTPMDWQTMYEKLDQNAYVTAGDFQSDVNLVIHNALLYNTVDSPHGKAAIKLRNGIAPILARLDDFDDPQSEIRRKHRKYLDTLDDAYIDQLMSLEYPLQELPHAQPGISSTTDVPANQTIDMSLLPRNGIPEIRIAGGSSMRPLHPYEGARPADIHSAPGFRAPRHLGSPFGFGLEEPAPVAGPSNAIKPRASTSNRKAPKLTAAGEKEKKREQNRAWRARRKARLAGEKAARERAAIIAAGRDPDAIAAQAAGAVDGPDQVYGMQVDDPVLLHSVQTMQVPNEVLASTPKVEAEEPHLLRSPSMPTREATSLDAATVPEVSSSSTSVTAPRTSSSVNVAPPEAVVASGSRDRSPSFQNGVPRINGWGAAIDRVEPPNDHEANLLFNEGWILPQGSKRRRASSANTEASGPVLKSRKGSLPATSVSPMFPPLTLPASAPVASIPLPPLPEQSSSPDLSEVPPSEQVSEQGDALVKHWTPPAHNEATSEIDPAIPSTAVHSDFVEAGPPAPVNVIDTPVSVPLPSPAPVEPTIVADPESELSDIEEDSNFPPPEQVSSILPTRMSPVRSLRSRSPAKAAPESSEADVEGSWKGQATPPHPLDNGLPEEAEAARMTTAPPVDAADESELSDIEDDTVVDQDVSMPQDFAGDIKPVTPPMRRPSSRTRASSSRPPSRSASKAARGLTQPGSKRRGRPPKSRNVASRDVDMDEEPDDSTMGQPLADAIAAIFEKDKAEQGDTEETAVGNTNGVTDEEPDLEDAVSRRPSSRRKSSSNKSATVASGNSPAPSWLAPRKTPAKKAAKGKRGARKLADAKRKDKPSVTISNKTLMQIYENKPASFVYERMGHLLPHVQYHSIEEVNDYDLVWARNKKSGPFWPAEVCLDVEERDGDVPQSVLDLDPKKTAGAKREASADISAVEGDVSMSKTPRREKGYDHYILVQWFPQDTKSTWSWIPFHPDFITQLGESKEYDVIMRNKYPFMAKRTGKGNNPKTDAKNIRDAYENAFRNMQTPPASDADEELQEFDTA